MGFFMLSKRTGLFTLLLACASCARAEGASVGQSSPSGAGGAPTKDASPPSGGATSTGGVTNSGGSDTGGAAGSAGAAGAPAQSNCEVVEDFEAASFPELPWMWGSAQGPVLGSQAAHDGAQGLMEIEWSLNQFVKVGKPGDRLRAWVRGTGGGRAYLGFGTTPGHTKALVFAPNATSLILNDCPSLYEFTDVATAKMGFSVGAWYQLVIDFGDGGLVTGHLYESDGKTEAASVAHTFPDFEPAGIAVRAFGSTYIDTIEVCHAE